MPDVKEELMQYRLSMARERLHSAEILLQDGSYKDSIGRSYYAMFTAVRALLAMDGQDFSNYADFFLVSSEDAQEQHDRASELLDAIE